MLKLKHLVMDNFMCVSHAELDFENEDVVLLVGDNGSGKSTVLEAIAFCLSEHVRADKFSDYIKSHTDEARIQLTAELRGAPAVFDIKLKEKTSDKTLTLDGKVYKNSEVAVALEPYELKFFSKIILSMQNDADITVLKPAERKAYLQNLLNFDFSDQSKECKDQITELKSKIDKNNSNITFNEQSIESRKKEIRDTVPLQNTPEEIDVLNQEITELHNQQTALSEKVAEREKLSLEKTNLISEISAMNTSISVLQNDIVKIQSSVPLIQSEIQNIKNELESGSTKFSDELKKYEDSKSSSESLISKLTAELEELRVARDAISDEELTAKKTGLIRSQAMADSEYQHAVEHIALVAKGVCPECGHAFDATDKAKYETASAEASAKLERIKSDIVSVDSEIAEMRGKKNKASEAYNLKSNELAGKNSELRSVDAQIISLKNSIAQFEARKPVMEQDIATKEAQISEVDSKVAEKNASIEAVRSTIVSKEARVNEIDELLKGFGDFGAENNAISNALREKQAVVNAYNQVIIENNGILTNNEAIRKNIETMTADIETYKQTVESYRKQLNSYEEVKDIFDRELPAYLILRTCKTLEQEMNDFISVIFPQMNVHLEQKTAGVEFKYTLDKLDIPDDKDRIYRTSKMSSGFEKAVLSMAFKVSLCKAYGLSFSFMDEIDKDGTEENAERMFESIISNDIFDQLFIISHKPSVRSIISSYASKLKTYYVKAGEFSIEES